MPSRPLCSATALLAALLLATASHAQEGTTEWEEMTSIALGEPRTFGIYLPPSYHTADKHYPSFYVLHGKEQNASSRAGMGSPASRWELAAGRHGLHWDGLDDRGLRVATSVYVYQIRTPAASLSRKLMLVE